MASRQWDRWATILWIDSVWLIQSEKRDLWCEKWQHESQITRIRNFINFLVDLCFYTSFLRGHIRKCEIISLTFWHISKMWDLHISHILGNVNIKPSHFWSFISRGHSWSLRGIRPYGRFQTFKEPPFPWSRILWFLILIWKHNSLVLVPWYSIPHIMLTSFVFLEDCYFWSFRPVFLVIFLNSTDK